MRGRAIPVVKSEVHGLPMPAHAEVVIEGVLLPDETREEGPFGEFMGYYASNASEQPIVRVERIYHRNDPILTLAIPSRPPENFTFARATVKSAMIWEEIEKAGLPGVQGVWCHEAGAGRLFNVVSIRQMYPGHASQAAMLAANCHAGNYAGRWVVVVDEDIDPSQHVRRDLGDVDALRSARGHPVHQARLVDPARSAAARAAVPQQPRHRRRLPPVRLEGRIPHGRRGEPRAEGPRARQVAAPLRLRGECRPPLTPSFRPSEASGEIPRPRAEDFSAPPLAGLRSK